jgi:hypothetical protein
MALVCRAEETSSAAAAAAAAAGGRGGDSVDCGGNSSSSSNSDELQGLQQAVMVHAAKTTAAAAANSGGTDWYFAAAHCQSAPGCEPGDVLLFPHYLHLRPRCQGLRTSGRDESGPLGLLEAVTSLQQTSSNDEQQPVWRSSKEGIEVVRSLR